MEEGCNLVLPSVATLEVTYKCNHQCLFCSCPWEADAGYRQTELSTHEWKNIIESLSQRGVKTFTFTGGEPLLRDDLLELISYVKERGKTVTLISNGRLMSDEILDFLAHHKVNLCISLPGIKTYKRHTGIDNANNILRLFEKTKEKGIFTTANITVTKLNLPELFNNIAYPIIRGADYILLNRFMPGGRGLQNMDMLLDTDELNQMLDIAEEVLQKSKHHGHVGTELPLCAVYHPEKYERIHISSRCAAGKEFFVIDPSGYIKVCNHSPLRLCRFSEIDLLKDMEYWKKFQRCAYLPDKCMTCGNTDKCDGGCREAAHVLYGSISDTDPILH